MTAPPTLDAPAVSPVFRTILSLTGALAAFGLVHALAGGEVAALAAAALAAALVFRHAMPVLALLTVLLPVGVFVGGVVALLVR